MRIHFIKPLFPWDCLEDSPSLQSIEQFLAAVPDAKLIEGGAKGDRGQKHSTL